MTEEKNPFLLDVAHEMVKGLYKAGIINGVTLREYDLFLQNRLSPYTS